MFGCKRERERNEQEDEANYTVENTAVICTLHLVLLGCLNEG